MTISGSKRTRMPPSPITPRPILRIDVCTRRDRCVIHVAGELDRATCDQFVDASTAGHHSATTIDLGGVTFMDSSGYDALVVARQVVESDGRSLAIRGQTGQPARLWKVIADLESGDGDSV